MIACLVLFADKSAWVLDSAACGSFGPSIYLAAGGSRIDDTPEFYWRIEMRRLALAFKPVEKRVTPPPVETKEEPPTPEASEGAGEAPAEAAPVEDERPPDRTLPQRELTARADLADFAQALAEKRFQPENPRAATEQHATARATIVRAAEESAPPLPAEADSEFADYHRGAYAFRRGPAFRDEARQAWQDLLARPTAQRHYRSVWAAFMLGKLALEEGKAEAAAWMQKTRALAAEGFADSLGMAADSYGWEARAELMAEHWERAAELYLTQLALGDQSALSSLKCLLPKEILEDAEVSETDAAESTPIKAAPPKPVPALATAASSPLLRKLVTLYVLATEGGRNPGTRVDTDENPRGGAWLAAVEKAGLSRTEDAEYLGWAAYNAADFSQASRWLKLAKADAPAGHWLQAKLLRRQGKLGEAAPHMLAAWKAIHGLKTYTAPLPASEEGDSERQSVYHSSSDEIRLGFEQHLSGDLAAMRLSQGEFVQAMDIFRRGGLWVDAAYVAERILSTDELKRYVDMLPPEPEEKVRSTEEEEQSSARQRSIRHLLARRLVREGRISEAVPYIPLNFRPMLAAYAKALQGAAEARLPKEARARRLFTAAWIARYSGMEIMGTEGAPDSYVDRGGFEREDLAVSRTREDYEVEDFSEARPVLALRRPTVLRATAAEAARLKKTRPEPNRRFHYRYRAAELAMKAAALLPTNSPELADVINQAGLWVKDRDEALGDRYYQVLERRCPQTEIGRAAIAQHWFVDQPGPWSTAERATHDALLLR